MKIKNIPNTSSMLDLQEIKNTNQLFLDLLYNLSCYPHPQRAKQLVRKGLFAFEEDNVIKMLKEKNNRL